MLQLKIVEFQRLPLTRGYSTRHEARHGLTPPGRRLPLPTRQSMVNRWEVAMVAFIGTMAALQVIGGTKPDEGAQ
jgi:hypothetical protein